jgi:hypothetical protein
MRQGDDLVRNEELGMKNECMQSDSFASILNNVIAKQCRPTLLTLNSSLLTLEQGGTPCSI